MVPGLLEGPAERRCDGDEGRHTDEVAYLGLPPARGRGRVNGIFCWYASFWNITGKLASVQAGDPRGNASISPLPRRTPRLPPSHPWRCLCPGFGMRKVRWCGFFLSLLSVF